MKCKCVICGIIIDVKGINPQNQKCKVCKDFLNSLYGKKAMNGFQEIQELKQQLAEKTLTIERINKAFLENRSLWKGKYEQSNQDKISFAVKQLEKVKEKLLEELQNVTDLLDPLEYEDYHELIGCGRGYKNSIEEIDNQINELKERCKND